LEFPVDANKTYAVEASLMVVGPNTAADWKFGWSLPAGATMRWGLVSGLTGTDDSWDAASTGNVPRDLLTESESLARGSQSGATFPILLKGTIRTAGTAGDVKLQWAQNTSDAGNSTVKADSYLRITDIR